MHITFIDRATVSRDVPLDRFNDFGSIEIYNELPEDEIINTIQHSDIIITNKVIMNKKRLSALPNLKLICLTATGTNNIDLVTANQLGIGVCNVAGYSTECVTQHTFALLFYLLEHLPKYDTYVKSKNYTKQSIFTYLGYRFWEISGKQWGIIGLGAIGRRVAEIASAFSCKVSYYSTSKIDRKEDYPRVELQTLLERSDVISIHAPLNESTRYLLGKEELALMQPHTILLNLGRGSIIDEPALAQALKDGTIAAAGLDVLEKEPIQADNPLLDPDISEKIIITPHIAWGSYEAQQSLFDEIYKNIESFIAGEKRNRVD